MVGRQEWLLCICDSRAPPPALAHSTGKERTLAHYDIGGKSASHDPSPQIDTGMPPAGDPESGLQALSLAVEAVDGTWVA